MKQLQIVIAGGGIAGLANAIAAARAGHKVDLFEQAAEFRETGAGLQTGPNGVRALKYLGAWDAVAPAVVTPWQIVISDGLSGQKLAQIELDRRFAERFGAPYRVVHRGDLLKGLLQTAQSHKAIALHTGMQLDDVQLEGGRAVACFAGGHTVSADLLIGADGGRSRVRRWMLNDGDPVYAGHCIYRALVPMDGVHMDRLPGSRDFTAVRLWLCGGGHVVHYPVSGGRQLNIVAAFDSAWSEPGWSTKGNRDELLAAFAGGDERMLEVLRAPRQWLKWAGADRPAASRWRRGPVVLSGDAAHPTLPYLAQGAAMALEDGVVLGGLLAQLDKGAGDVEAMIARFQKIRRPRTAKVVSASRRLGRVYHARGLKRALRNLVLKRMPASSHFDRLDWLYSWKP